MIQTSMRQMATLLASALLMVGCTSQTTKSDQAVDGARVSSDSDTANKVVETRAVERWDLLIARKAEKAYDYLSPGFRATKKREDYATEMNNRPVHWDKVLPYSQHCDKPDVCVVSLQVDADVKMPGVRKNVSTVGFVTETWIRTRGKWYMLPNAQQAAGTQ